MIRSLQCEDGLSQVEIAVLLGRHKSWVCRHLSLVERLCDGVMDHLKLGLINTTTARELARLPGGNQPDAHCNLSLNIDLLPTKPQSLFPYCLKSRGGTMKAY